MFVVECSNFAQFIMKQLTKAEEQIMQILWKLKEGIVKDVVDEFEGTKPAYTTVATVLKVLEKKGFASHRTIGNTHLFQPAISKKEYARDQISTLVKNYFNGSFPRMATFFASENNISIEELEQMLKLTEEEIKNEKDQ